MPPRSVNHCVPLLCQQCKTAPSRRQPAPSPFEVVVTCRESARAPANCRLAKARSSQETAPLRSRLCYDPTVARAKVFAARKSTLPHGRGSLTRRSRRTAKGRDYRTFMRPLGLVDERAYGSDRSSQPVVQNGLSPESER